MRTYTTMKKQKFRFCALTCMFGCIIMIIMLYSYTCIKNNTSLTLLQNIVIAQTSSMEQLVDSRDNNFTYLSQKLIVDSRLGTMADDDELYDVTDITKEVECDIFYGTWVYKPESNPIYNAWQCPFLSEQVSCQKNGRPDFDYEHWSWEAKGCHIPRFDGLDMLERLRGKRVILVGDSINRNQWESLACLLYSVLPPSRAHVEVHSHVYKVFRSEDYNCSVEFYWSPFLVQLDDSKGQGRAVLRLDKLDASAKNWEGADIMVFNSGHWWAHAGKKRAWDVFEHDGKLDENMELESAMELAMKTWAHWVKTKVDRRRTRVFFRSITAAHNSKYKCFGKTMPLIGEEYSKIVVPELVVNTVERVIGSMEVVPVKYLNITKLTQFRVDAHPGIFSLKKGEVHPDCSHWCLPGVPDTWNRLLYATILLDMQKATLQLETDQISSQKIRKFH